MNRKTPYIINKVEISPCDMERRELLKMPTAKPIIEESEHDNLKESPNPCLF